MKSAQWQRETPGEIAEHLARVAHNGAWNKAGQEWYIFHPERVAGYLDKSHALLGDLAPEFSVRNLQEACATAWLHDTVEDTWVTEQMVECTLGPRVAQLVMLLTRPEGGGGDEYYEKIREEPVALWVKFSDLMDNGDPVRIARVEDPDKRKHFRTKYSNAAQVLGVEEAYTQWTQFRKRTTSFILATS